MMAELWLALAIGLPISVIIVVAARRAQHAERERSKPTTVGPSGRVALLGVPSLDTLADHPRGAEALRGRVRSIYVMSLPTFTSSGEAGNDVVRNSGMFIIDTEGALHEPSGFRPPLELEALGAQLAEELGVPFDLR